MNFKYINLYTNLFLNKGIPLSKEKSIFVQVQVLALFFVKVRESVRLFGENCGGEDCGGRHSVVNSPFQYLSKPVGI